MGVVDPGAAPEGDGLRAIALPGLLHLFGDQGQRLVPARLAPLPRAAFTGADQRVVEPVGVVELLDRGRPRLRAQEALVDRVIEVAEHPADGAVHLLHDGAAAAMAHAADRLEALHEVAADPLRLVGPQSHSRPPRQGPDDPSTGDGDQGERTVTPRHVDRAEQEKKSATPRVFARCGEERPPHATHSLTGARASSSGWQTTSTRLGLRCAMAASRAGARSPGSATDHERTP